jgi:hypothetical protein
LEQKKGEKKEKKKKKKKKDKNDDNKNDAKSRELVCGGSRTFIDEHFPMCEITRYVSGSSRMR